MPAGTHLTGMCTKPGVVGGLTLLGALHRSPLACISLKGLAAQGGFQAAYLGVSDVIRHKGFQWPACCWWDWLVAADGGFSPSCVQATCG